MQTGAHNQMNSLTEMMRVGTAIEDHLRLLHSQQRGQGAEAAQQLPPARRHCTPAAGIVQEVCLHREGAAVSLCL